jgi:hypothetical protein
MILRKVRLNDTLIMLSHYVIRFASSATTSNALSTVLTVDWIFCDASAWKVSIRALELEYVYYLPGYGCWLLIDRGLVVIDTAKELCVVDIDGTDFY